MFPGLFLCLSEKGGKMVRRSKTVAAAVYRHLLCLHSNSSSIHMETEAGGRLLLSKTLSDVLACPLSKQPLRVCQESHSLISDALGVSFPIVDGIPCLVPGDGKLLQTEEEEEQKDK